MRFGGTKVVSSIEANLWHECFLKSLNMKELSIKFAEWVGINTFDGRYMRHDVTSRGNHIWKLYYEPNEIRTSELYKKFCTKHDLMYSIEQRLQSIESKFIPILFMEYIGNEYLFYKRVKYKDTELTPYWTNQGRKLNLSTGQLFDKFTESINLNF